VFAYRGPAVLPHPEDDAKGIATCRKTRVVFALDNDPSRESTRFELVVSGRRREKAPQCVPAFSNLVTIRFAPFTKVAGSVLPSQHVSGHADHGGMVVRTPQIQKFCEGSCGLYERSMNAAINARFPASLPNEMLAENDIAAERFPQHPACEQGGTRGTVGEKRARAFQGHHDIR
jgi:hypothetical protein